jgi:NitT/TauT family transport system substrate-binding protein
MLSRRTFVSVLVAATAARARAGAAATATVRIGSVPVDNYAQPYFGDGTGIFRDAGIAVEISALANSGAIAAAVAGGSLDVGLGSPSQIAGGSERGLPFTFFAPGSLYTADAPAALLMVAKDSPVRSARDLAGKTIAVDNLTSFSQVTALLWLKANGVDAAAVKFVEIPFSAMAAALETGRIDAANISEPSLSAARPTTRFLADTNAAIGPMWYISSWFTTKDWLAANLALGHRLAQATVRTSIWANAHHRESAAILAQYSKIPLDMILTMTRCRFATRLDPAWLNPPLQTAAKVGMIPAPVAPLALIYPGFAAT